MNVYIRSWQGCRCTCHRYHNLYGEWVDPSKAVPRAAPLAAEASFGVSEFRCFGVSECELEPKWLRSAGGQLSTRRAVGDHVRLEALGMSPGFISHESCALPRALGAEATGPTGQLLPVYTADRGPKERHRRCNPRLGTKAKA